MPINARFRPRVKMAELKPGDFLDLRAPEDPMPIWPILAVWSLTMLPDGRWIFPSIELPDPGTLDVVNLGLDYDGSMIGLVLNYPDAGKTIVTHPPMNNEGKVVPCTIH